MGWAREEWLSSSLGCRGSPLGLLRGMVAMLANTEDSDRECQLEVAETGVLDEGRVWPFC